MVTKSPSAVFRGAPPTALHQPIPSEIVTLLNEIIAGSQSIADLTALVALTSSEVTAGTTIEMQGMPGGEFFVFAGSAASNGMTHDGVVVVQNTAGNTTFVRLRWLLAREVDLSWFEPAADGIDNSSSALQLWLDALAALATEDAPATGIVPPGVPYLTNTELEIGSWTRLDGGGTLAAHADLPLTASLLTNAALPTGGERLAYGIEIRNITFDGAAREYPVWLMHTSPHEDAGEPVTDPEADYSSPGVVDTGQYGGGGDIFDIVAAGRRNAAAPTTHGYLVRLRGVVDPVVENCTFLDHGSFTTVMGGCLRDVVRNCTWERCGRIDTISPALLSGNEGSHRVIAGRTAADPVVITTLGAFPNIVHGMQIDIRSEATAGLGLPDGTYTVLNPSGSTFELGDSGGSPVNGTGLGNFGLNGRAMVGTAGAVLAEDSLAEGCRFIDLNRIAIHVSGNRQTISECKVMGGKEVGIYSPFTIDLTVHDCTVDGIQISDIVAHGFEGAGTGLTFSGVNRFSRLSECGIRIHGMFGGRVDGATVFRAKHRGSINYPYGPFSERYSFGIGTAPLAGTAVEDQKFIPIDARSEELYPVSGSISRNKIIDSRSSSTIPGIAIYFGEVGSETERVRNLRVEDNDLSEYTSNGDPADLLEYATNAVDFDSVVIRGNHPAPDGYNVSYASFLPLASSRAVTAGESGRRFHNTGASAIVVVDLPAPALGLEYGFYVTDTDGFRIRPTGGAAIRVGTSVGSTNIENATAGSSVWLIATGSNWFATDAIGTWSAT